MRTPSPLLVPLAVLTGAVALTACSGGSSADEGTEGASSTRAAATSSSPAPADFRAALETRLAEELGDRELAAEVTAGMSAEAVASLEEALAGADPARAPLLAYQPDRVPAGVIDSVVVFAYGNRIGVDGATTGGPVNDDLADAVVAFVAEHPVPVFAQWEVADFLEARGVDGVVSIDPDAGPNGDVVYLSTEGVAEKAMALAEAHGVDLGHVGVIAFADHAVRSLMTARKAGMTADVPRGVELPSTYDPQSGQAWTRSRVAYIPVDLQGRLLLLDENAPG